MRIQCPQCGVKGSLDEAFAGRNVRCPKCRALFAAGPELRPAEPETRDTVVPEAEHSTLQKAVVEMSGEDERIGEESAGKKPQQQEERTVDSGAADIPEAKLEEKRVIAGLPPGAKEPGGAEGGSTAEAGTVPPLAEQGGDQGVPEFSIGWLINRSWDLTRGVKSPIWVALLITYGVVVALVVALAALMSAAGEGEGGPLGMITDLVSSALSTLFTAGLMFMGVKRATGRRVIWKDVFSGFDFWGKILIAAILKMLLVVIGFMLLMLPGIYLMIGYLFTIPLIIDKQMSPWQAMETSRKAVHKVWWKILGLYFVVGLICIISAIPFGIGLIWTMPLAVVLYGVVYNALFGTRKPAE